MRAARFEALRYAGAAALIAATCGGLAFAFGGTAPDEPSLDPEGAVMVDLQAAEPSAHPPNDAADGPEQQAAAPSQAAPDAAKAETKPAPDMPPEPSPEMPVEPPPPAPEAERPLKAVEKPVEPQPQSAAQAPSAAREEAAPSGSDRPVKVETEDGGESRPRPSARVITLWQRSLMRRLEGARRQFASARHESGTVTVAFIIDQQGALVSEQVAASSGSPALDAAGLRLVRQAAPFPTPPAGSHDGDLSFTIPIRFK